MVVQSSQRLTLPARKQPLNVLMGGVPIIIRIVRELPQRVRHVPIGVLIDVRPTHTDDIKHGVDTLRNGVTHDATAPV
ncbi:hypothetical protein ACFRMN_01500 [Streptomyces sp. NPDC056835]|uniref:hypothetical protein n=1 Tax=Streptomyces sp. NPDC056835 TaxID=3345956 RepID=UPI0036B54E48